MVRLNKINYFLYIFLAFVIGCASQKFTLDRNLLDTHQEIAFIKDNNQLWLTNVFGDSLQKLVEMPSFISSPSWSPNGDYLAFITSKNSSIYLYYYDTIQKKVNELTSLAINKEMLNSINAPKWSNDNTNLFYIDSIGIHNINILKEDRLIFRTDYLVDFDLSNDNNKIVFSLGKEIFLYNLNDNTITNLSNKSSNLNNLIEKEITYISFSKNDQRIALAEGKRIIILDLKTYQAEEILKNSDNVQWINWLSESNKVVYLSGISARDYSMIRNTVNVNINSPDVMMGTETWKSKSSGRLKLYTILISTLKNRKIFNKLENAESANPTLSPDGKYIALISNPLRSVKKVFIVSTDGSGWMQVTKKGMCSNPVWRP
jgi:Tol biopolymer transport system component